MIINRTPTGCGKHHECTDDPGDLFVVVAEWANQGPIVMETEGPFTSFDMARTRIRNIEGGRGFLRVCIARLVFDSGNALVLHDLKRMQKPADEGDEA